MLLHTDISGIDPLQWQTLSESSPSSSFFQTCACYDFYASMSFLKPFVFGVSEHGRLMGVLCGYIIADGNVVKRFFSRRAIMPGGALLAQDISAGAVQMLFRYAAHALARKAIYVEIRNYNDYSARRPDIEAAGFNYVPHLDIQVPTPDVETALRHMSVSKRRQLKTAQQAGVTWHETTDRGEVRAFYEVLKKLYRTKVKKPLFPREFFEKLAGHPQGKLLVVKLHGKVIGGMACVILPGQCLYEWFVCGAEHTGKEAYASVVATWAGIEFAAANGIPRFDFMGAGSPENDYGVRNFKSKFGGQIAEHGRFLYICSSLLYALGKIGIKLLQKL